MNILYRGETKDLDENARKTAPGKFVELSKGITHYKQTGQKEGQAIVLIHGIAGPLGIWQQTTTALVKQGFQVLLYDLYGRGFSDHPRTEYNISLFVEQLRELLSKLSITLPVTLIGWSLGGMVSSVYAARYPENVDRLVLVAPAGIDVKLTAISRIGLLPILGDLLMITMGQRLILRSLISGVYRKELIEDYQSLLTEQMKYRGYLQAFHSTLRKCVNQDISEELALIKNHKLPVMLITGKEDHSIPATVATRLKELIPKIKHWEIEEVGHLPHFEKPDDVNLLIRNFLLEN